MPLTGFEEVIVLWWSVPVINSIINYISSLPNMALIRSVSCLAYSTLSIKSVKSVLNAVVAANSGFRAPGEEPTLVDIHIVVIRGGIAAISSEMR